MRIKPTPSDVFELGSAEWAALPDLGVPAILARIDTGARTSALHASAIEVYAGADGQRVRFTVHPVTGRKSIARSCDAPLVARRWVASSNGTRELRCVVRTSVRIGARSWPIEVTLADRRSMRYPMLLGRTAILADMVVLPSRPSLQPVIGHEVYDKRPRAKRPSPKGKMGPKGKMVPTGKKARTAREKPRMPLTALELTRELTRFDTINPPGNELACAEHLGRLLEGAGFACRYEPFAPGRPNLMATIGGRSDRLPLAFTGHIDVVPLGTRAWRHDPFASEIADGRIYGRGSSDMKAGVAGFVAAAIELAPRLAASAGVTLIITAGEETGCEGAFHLARTKAGPGAAGALVVAEPTSNRPLVGHRGAFWLKALTHGVTAHGSMPDKGVNALYKMARAITALEAFDFNVARHPVLGPPTLNVGWSRGGINVNSVPDRAETGIDMRTIPAQDHAALLQQIAAYLGPEVELEPFMDVRGVWSDPEGDWMRRVFATVADVCGAAPAVEAAPYFTDASALVPMLGGPPTVILGPGEAHMAHQTDEYCEIGRIEQAVEINKRLLRDWCEL